MSESLTIAEAMSALDVGRSRIGALVTEGRLVRVKSGHRSFITRSSIDSYRECQERRQPWSGKSVSKVDQRAIVETLLLAGVITRDDIARQERVRIANAIRKARSNNNTTTEDVSR